MGGWPNGSVLPDPNASRPPFAWPLPFTRPKARLSSLASHSLRPVFCSWQAGGKQINSRLRTCWLSLARPCSYSIKPRQQETIPFWTSARPLERKRNLRPGGMWAGVVGPSGDLDPVRDCRRRAAGLIRPACNRREAKPDFPVRTSAWPTGARSRRPGDRSEALSGRKAGWQSQPAVPPEGGRQVE